MVSELKLHGDMSPVPPPLGDWCAHAVLQCPLDSKRLAAVQAPAEAGRAALK